MKKIAKYFKILKIILKNFQIILILENFKNYF